MLAAVSPTNLARNRLLCALPRAELEHLLPYLQPVEFSLGQVVIDCNQPIDYVHFLTSSIVSLLYTTESGATAEMAIVGNDGLVGTAIFLGGESTCSRAVVAVAGEGLRMPAKVLIEEFRRHPDVQHVLLRYIQALLTQISQTAVCNRLHSFEQRLCRWLLLCHDRSTSCDLRMTQELIAHMLGGRRESVTVAAGHLQDLGLIHYCRGRITILNRSGLEASACECYRVVERDLARLWNAKRSAQPTPTCPALKEAG